MIDGCAGFQEPITDDDNDEDDERDAPHLSPLAIPSISGVPFLAVPLL